MASEAVENYLKAIDALAHESPTGEAGMKRLATVVGVTTGTATSMCKKLAAARLVKYERFGGISLTAKGQAAARDILRRHRLIETFLVETLKLDWSVVHAEAERLEHAISPVVLEALDRHLGHPSVDPHGDPIPDGAGAVGETSGRALGEFEAGSRVRIVRVSDQEKGFLEFVARHGLKPGTAAVVNQVDRAAQAIRVTPDGLATVSMGFGVAAKIMAESRG
ncbi:MAG: metal-dependent transcriptional regulator [Planctomycetes bacterium]|nr:metal-dependent transcriptional regulator [Planctomycetota bacterium]